MSGQESLGLGGEPSTFDPSAGNGPVGDAATATADAMVADADANAEAGEGADAEAELGGAGDDADDVRELPRQSVALDIPSANPSVKNLTAIAMNRLNGVVESAKLSEEEFGIVTRAVSRLTELAVLQTAGQTPKEATTLSDKAELDLATLAAISASKQIDVEREVRNTVYLTVAESFRAAIGFLAKYAVAAVV